jgi:uncharacterized protein
MNDRRRWSWSEVPGSLWIALGTVLAAWIIGASAVHIANMRATITVTGSAKRQIRSDMVVWRGTYTANAPDIQAAYAALQASAQKVRAYLAGKGIAADSLVFGSITTRTFYAMGPRGVETSEVTGYQLAQTVEVRSSDVDRIGTIAREATELINQGVRFESMPPEYLYTKIADLKVAMLAQATQDAKARAEEMAHNSGSRIGRLRSARMGVFQITPAFSTQVSDYGINDTSSLLKDITAVVTVSFEIR